MEDKRPRKTLGSHSRTPSTTSQSHQNEFARARGPRRPKAPLNNDINDMPPSGDEWDDLGDKEPGDEDTWESVAEPPSYDFPGTWDTAIHQTSHAVREVTTASKSYYTAIYNSGIARAGWSIGSALAGTANRKALTAADWAVHSTGTDTEQLPIGVQRWLSKKETLDEAKRAALMAEKARLARKYKRHLAERGQVVDDKESSTRSRAVSKVSSQGRPSFDEFEDDFDELEYLPGSHARRPSHSQRRPSNLSTGLDIEDRRTTLDEKQLSPIDTGVSSADEWKWSNQDVGHYQPDFTFPGKTSSPPPSTQYSPTSREPRSSDNRPSPLPYQQEASPYPEVSRPNSGYFERYAVQSAGASKQFTSVPLDQEYDEEEVPDDSERLEYMSAASSVDIAAAQEHAEYGHGDEYSREGNEDEDDDEDDEDEVGLDLLGLNLD